MPYYPYFPKDNESNKDSQDSELFSEVSSDEKEAEDGKRAEQEKEHISLDEYLSRKHIFFADMIIDLLIVAFFLAILCVFGWATLSTIGESVDGGVILFGLFFFFALIVGALYVVYKIGSLIAKHVRGYMAVKNDYVKNAPAEELALQKKRAKKRAITFVSVSGVLLFILIAAFSVKPLMTAIQYNKAEKLIEKEEYSQAINLLSSIKDTGYKDTEALLQLCDAHKLYDAGNILDAYYSLNRTQFKYQSESQQAKIESFREILKKDYEPIADANRAQVEKWNREYLNKIKNGVPFVGMPDEYINDTSLGEGTYDGEERYLNKNGKLKKAWRYKFYNNGKCVFIALCDGGYVVEVRDYRVSESSSYVPKNNSGSRYDNSPSVEGFSNPEDFYDWYYDDFFDYEEAEDYYYSHGGW